MLEADFSNMINLLNENFNRKVCSFDLLNLRENILGHAKSSFEKAIEIALCEYNPDQFFNPSLIIELSKMFENEEAVNFTNEGHAMLREEIYYKMIRDFQAEFDMSYGFKREALLYSAVSYLTEVELSKALIELLINNNKAELPTIRSVTAMAYRVAPEKIKQGQMNPCKLNLA